jgi:hypothetical protein
MKRHLIIPDAQVKPESRTEHIHWAGEAILEYKPDVVGDTKKILQPVTQRLRFSIRTLRKLAASRGIRGKYFSKATMRIEPIASRTMTRSGKALSVRRTVRRSTGSGIDS